MEDTYEAVTEQLGPDLQRAYAADDEEGLQGVADQVAALVEVLDAAFNKLGLKQQTQVWVQVSKRGGLARLLLCCDGLGREGAEDHEGTWCCFTACV